MAVDSTWLENGAVLRLTLNSPKGNVLDSVMMAALQEAFDGAARNGALRAVVLDAAGRDFSWGASVEEHRPEQCAGMLERFHALLLSMVELPLPVLVAVSGRCLGGGLELALAGSRLFVAPTAQLGQPEVKLGVFAPAASALLAERIGPALAEELLVSGRSVTSAEALAAGLVDEVCPADVPPADVALAYAKRSFFEPSRTAVRFAVRAARLARAAELRLRLASLERLYLDELMRTADAREGITSFIEKRAPRWTHELPR